MLFNDVVLDSLLSLSTITLFLLYAGPATLRITTGRHRFVPGPFNLGWAAYPIGIVSTAWWVFSLCVFSLPTEQAVTVSNLNWAPILLVITIITAIAWYMIMHNGNSSSRQRGPDIDLEAFEKAQLSMDKASEQAVGGAHVC
jgi:hypothetical protein